MASEACDVFLRCRVDGRLDADCPNSMTELIQHAIAPLNLPFTILLGVVVLYWLMVIVGGMDFGDSDGGAALDHGGVDVDGHVDAGVDGHADGHFDGDAHGHGHGFFGGIAHFLHLGEVPFMIVASILILVLWMASMLVNYYFNPGLVIAKGLMLLVPVLVGGVVVTHFLALPFKKIFRLMEKDYDSHKPIIGQVGTVVTGEVSATFGQISIDMGGVHVTLNARTAEGSKLEKGDLALVVEKLDDRGIYRVVEHEQTKLED